MSAELLSGIHSIEAALKYDAENVTELYIESGQQNPRVRELAERARELGIKPHARDRADLDRMTGGARHQGIAAMYKTPPARSESDLPKLIESAGQEALFLVLDGVTDPHNLGACLRSAEAAGVTAVIVPKDKAVGITPTVRRASAGAADRVAFVAATNLARSRGAQGGGVGLPVAGDATQSLYDGDSGGLRIVMAGRRRHAPLPGNLRPLATITVGAAGVESLNVSVAAGVFVRFLRATR